jgi:ferrous iron transport protein A
MIGKRIISMDMKDLTQLTKGKIAQVVEINGGHEFKEKVDAIGLRVGSKIIKLSAQMMKGPVTIQIGNTKLAIGHGMAKKIFVDGNYS